MRRLVLLRHAKSDWSTPGQPDHARPLNLRGRLAASLMAAWLQEQPWRVAHVWVSDATRTQETLERLTTALPTATVETTSDLYLAEPEEMMTVLRRTPDMAETVLMIGHNPGLEAFAADLCAPSSPRPPAFPTAAVAEMTLCGPMSWRDARARAWRLETFEQPKSLV